MTPTIFYKNCSAHRRPPRNRLPAVGRATPRAPFVHFFHGVRPHRIHGEYKLCNWGAALAGDELRRKGYNFIYDTGSPWEMVREVHRKQLEHRMASDTAEQAEKEEAVFTSGAIIGSESFVNRIVKENEESFPTGHKTSPVNFGIGGVVLKTLRNLSALR